MLASLNHPHVAAIYGLEAGTALAGLAAPPAFIVMELANGNNEFVMDWSGDRKPSLYLDDGFDLRDGRFSPDGRWVPYTAMQPSGLEVDVTPGSPLRLDAPRRASGPTRTTGC